MPDPDREIKPAPPRRIGAGRIAALLALAVLALTALAAGNEREDLLVAFINPTNQPLEVSVDGDRLLIIRPASTEFLDVNAVAWAWPRTIEIRRWPHGDRLARWQADLTDLSDANWRYIIY